MRLRGGFHHEVAHAARNLGHGRPGLQSPQLRDALLLLGDESVELQHLDRVVPLLPFPESENISHVRRPRTVEKPLVLAENRLPQRLDRRTGPPASRLAAAEQAVLQGLGRDPVTRPVEMNAVVRQPAAAGRGGPFHRPAQRLVQRKKRRGPLRRELPHDGGRALEFRVVPGRIGPRCTQILVPHRAHQHHTRTGGDLREGVQQALIVRPEFFPAGLALERRRHPVAHEHDRRFRVLELFDELRPAFFGRLLARLQQTQAKPGVARRCIPAPAQIAKRHVPLGKPRRQHELDPPVVLLALDQRVAEQHDPVPLAQLQPCRRVARGQDRQMERRNQGDAQENSEVGHHNRGRTPPGSGP